MTNSVFSFTEDKFNKLFPFYILIDSNLNVISYGASIKKLFPLGQGRSFFANFKVARPKLVEENLASLSGLQNQLVIIYHRLYEGIPMKGQLEVFDGDKLLYIGTPWFDSIGQVKENNLTVNDFAIHDSIIDLLHIVQTKEIANNDIKDLLGTYNEQSKTLKQREAELLETSGRMNQMIANLQNGVLVEDENRNIVLTNETFCTLFAIPATPEQMVGANCANFAEQSKNLFKDPALFLEELDQLLGAKEKKLNYIMELADGRFLSRDYIPVFFGDVYKGHLWKYTDVTESKLVEQKLESQKKFYEQILNEIPADIAVFDKSHRYLFVNPIGIKSEEIRRWIIGKNDIEYCTYRNRPLSIAEGRMKLFNEVAASKKQKEWEETVKKPDGEIEYQIRRMYPVFDEQGQLELMIGYGVNVTERRKIEEQIRLSEARYRSIFDYSLALICTHDLAGVVTDVNSTALSILGYSSDELVGSPVSKILQKDKVKEFEERYLSTILTKGKAEGVMVAVSKSGQRIYLLYQNYLVTEANGKSYVIGFSQNVTSRINVEKALKKSEEKYRGIIENMNLGMVEADDNQKVLYINSTFCKMCGYEEEEILGENFVNLFFHKSDLNSFTRELQSRRSNGLSDAYELMIKNKRGELRWWLVSGAPTFDNSGIFRGSLSIFLDITNQKALETELRTAKAFAENSAQAKELFLANMSHEIRTPMNAIMGIGRLLDKTELGTQQKQYLNTIQNAANNLLVIINDLLDFSKIEAGKLSLEYIGFDLNECINNVVRVLSHKFEEKGVFIKYESTRFVCPVLIGDPYRLNQVLINLVSNALKFTEKGAVVISCVLDSDTVTSQKIQFQVSDTGIGMSEEFLANLFDKFSQEDESVTRKYGGTGLGMSISKELVQLMGGSISASSKKDVGTTVTFTLNFNKGTVNDLPKTDSLVLEDNILSGKKVLLVEDNEMNRLLASTLLAQYGATVAEAENGAEAIDALVDGHDFDVILMDIQMPVKGGIETTTHIRENISKKIPIIALTANAFKEEKERCIKAGMNDFISKPFEELKLIQIVAKWLGLNIDIENQKSNVDEQSTLYDLKKLNAIGRGDKGFINKMLNLFVTTIPEALQQIQDAFDQKDVERIAAIAHRIKPSINNMCIHTLEHDIQILEGICLEPADLDTSLAAFKHIQVVLESVVRQVLAIIESTTKS